VKQTFTVLTRVNKNAKEEKSVVTLDFTGLNQEGFMALAAPTLIIKAQGEWRRSKTIPPAVTIVAKDNLPGTRHGMTLEQARAMMTLEQKKELAKQLAEDIAKAAADEMAAAKKVAAK
jgi:hypothetical protein